PAVAVELLALGDDDLLGRPVHEALVREHLLRALDLLAEALDLRVGVAVRFYPVGLDHRFEDRPLLVAEGDQDTAPTERRRRGLNVVERAGILGRSVVLRRPRRDDQAQLARRQ